MKLAGAVKEEPKEKSIEKPKIYHNINEGTKENKYKIMAKKELIERFKQTSGSSQQKENIYRQKAKEDLLNKIKQTAIETEAKEQKPKNIRLSFEEKAKKNSKDFTKKLNEEYGLNL